MNKCCSSCKKENSQLKKFDNNILICQKCLSTELKNSTPEIITGKSLTPKVLFECLNKKIIGQDEAKKALSVAVATHHCRLVNKEIQKSNILMIGPTGTGKTEMARSLAQITGVPFAIIDATTLTAHGYIGEDVESCLHQLLAAANYDQKAAEEGIVFIDEIDKLARGQEGSAENGIATVRVQQSLLKMMEGGKIKLTKPSAGAKSTEKDYIFFDTSKVLFICSGAFPGLEESLSNKASIGISNSYLSESEDPNNEQAEIKTHHLTKYGLIPEFLGRLPVVIRTQLLSEDDLLQILTKLDNSLIHQYQLILKNYGVNLVFQKSFLKLVAQEAFQNKLGARGLRSILEKKLQDLMFDGPSFKDKTVEMQNDGYKIITQVNVVPAIKTATQVVRKQRTYPPIEINNEMVAEKQSSKAKASKK